MAAELGLAAFSSIVSESSKTLFERIKRKISYVCKYQSYINGLKDQVKKLGDIKEMVQQHVNHATLQGEEIYQGVADWLRSVNEFTDKDDDRAEKSCCKGVCPNLLSRYKLGKQAAKAAKDAANLVEKGYLLKNDVAYRSPLESTENTDVKDYESFDSRMKLFQDVMEAVKDDKLNIIGVYGMGGVGKTTLVKQVRKQVMDDKSFDKVVMAEITQKPDPQKIQDELASDLGMKFDLNDSIRHRAKKLRQRLKKEKRVLIILDNVWTKLELDKVGIPSKNVEEEKTDDRRRYTVILTSRNRDLLCNMNSQKLFSIDALSKKEALQLFEKIVGDSIKNSAIQPIADEIVERCGGLPVALSTVANALKTRDRKFWEDALNQLRSSNLGDGLGADVYPSIKLSYDLLASEEAKSLFRLCGLFGEGHAIQVPSLLRYGMGFGLFEDVYTLEEARSRVHRLIDNLKSSCLLLDGDAKDEVKMHDVIHVVAVSICREMLMFNIPNVADVEKKMEAIISKDPIAISLPCRDFQELPGRLQCPNLQLFLLFTKGVSSTQFSGLFLEGMEKLSSVQISDLFFEGTKELKVLSLSGIRFSSLPSSLGRLINVQTLCLDNCQLQDIAIVGQLKKLEILSFRDSDIEELPLQIRGLTSLKLLDLSNCCRLKVVAPNVISELSRLEELYMGNSFSEWDKVEGGSNASLVELKGLSKLTTLEIHVQDAEILPQDLLSVELQRHRICIGKAWGRWSIKSETSRMMKLQGLKNVSILLGNYGTTKILLKKTEDLYLKKLKGVQNVVHELDGEGFPRLKHLQVKYCSEILHIVGLVGRVRWKVFPLLESLFLSDLINLETICYNQLTEDQSFGNLRIIEVKSCDKLKHLFSFSMAKNLLRLQKLEVAHCDKLKMIVGPDMEKPTTTSGIKEFAKDDPGQKVIFPSFKELKLEKLRNIEKLWPDQFQGMCCCQNLTKVTVWHCDRLKYLFAYPMVNSLVQLQHLEIWECESLEGVVDTTGLGREEGKFTELKVFPKLHTLELTGLSKLTSFVNLGHFYSHSVVEFPSLRILEISNCRNMLRFISRSSSEDNIHTETQPQPLFDEKVRLPSLEILHINWADKLRKLWPNQLALESFNKLKNLLILGCNNLINIFPRLVDSNTTGSLVILKVSFCEKIEEIIGHVGEEVKENRIAFGKLKVLKLDYLPRLTSFCLDNYTLEFPSLERVFMKHCPNMKTFSQGILSPPKLEEVQVSKKKNGKMHHRGSNVNSTIQKCYEEMVGFCDIEYLTLSHFPRLRELWHGQALPVSFFNNLVDLVLDDCTNMSVVIPANLLRCLNNLEKLEVRNCHSLEEVLHLEELNANEEPFGPLFPMLESLHLVDLQKLKRFCNFIGSKITLLGLSLLTIENCPNMETFVSNATSILHLTADNKGPQEITSEENFVPVDHIQPLLNEKVAFPYLYMLKLSRLPKLMHIWEENSESNEVFANLQILEISECRMLETLVPSSWHLENLTTLEVSKCHELINLSTLSTSESLVNLKTMKIVDCKMIEEIMQVGEEAKDSIVFRKLKYLGLDCLPSLTSFCSGNCTLQFWSLKKVVVRQCPKMKVFSQGVIDTPKLNKVKRNEEEEGCWEGNLNDTIKKLFNEMNSKDKIEPTFHVFSDVLIQKCKNTMM